jgi:hypothetical protein
VIATAPTLVAEDLNRLCALIEEETAAYRRLHRLAVRQNHYMRRQDTDRLESNTRDWERAMPEIEDLRKRRETLQRSLVDRHGWPRDVETLEQWADRNGHPEAERIVELKESWQEAADDLARQNQLNGNLAKFCLDLVADEAEVFRRGVQDADGGSYDENGKKSDAGTGGVVTHRA